MSDKKALSNVVLPVASLALAVLAFWVLALIGGLTMRVPLDARRLVPDGGHAFHAPLNHVLLAPADDGAPRWYGPASVRENGADLGPGKQLHAEIRANGSGRFALDGRIVRFSASDNSDPRTNGRNYTLVSSVAPAAVVSAAAALAVAVLAGIMGWRPARLSLTRRRATILLPALALAVLAAGLLMLRATSGIDVLPSQAGAAALLGVMLLPVLPWARLWHAWQRLDTALTRRARAKSDWLARPRSAPALLLLALSAFWTATLWQAQPLNPNYNDTLTPSLWYTGQLVTHPGTIQHEVYPHLQVLLPRLADAVYRLTGLPVEAFHNALAAGFVAVGLVAVGLAALRLGNARGAFGAIIGCLAIAVFVQGWPGKMQVGYPALFHMPGFLLGAWGVAASIAVWAFWLLAAERRRTVAIAFGLAGLVFDLHSTYGVILLGIMLTGLGLDGLRRGRIAQAMGRMVIGAMAFAAVAAPQLWFLMAHGSAVATQSHVPPAQDWWTLMAFRKPFHIFIWGEHGVSGPLAWLLAYWTMAMVALWPLVERGRAWRLVATGLATVIFCAIAYGAFALYPTPLLVGLVLTRAALIPMVGLAILLTALVALLFRAWQDSESARDAIRLCLAAIALALLGLPDGGAEVRYLGLTALAAVAVIGCLPREASVGSAMATALRPIALVATLIALSIPLVLLPTKWRETVALMPARDGAEWAQVTTFLREQTSVRDMALMPPYPYAMASSLKASPGDYGQMGYSVYARWLIPFEQDQIALLYGVNLREKTPSTITSWLAENGGLLCLVERSYSAIVSDVERLRQLRLAYPALRLVVAPKPGTTPEGWTCGPAATTPVPLKTLFENSGYVVYSLDG